MTRIKLLPDSWRWHQIIVAGVLLYIGLQMGGFFVEFMPNFIAGAAGYTLQLLANTPPPQVN